MFKKAQQDIGSGLVWIFVLLGFVGTGLIFVVLNQVMNSYVIPAFGSVAIATLNSSLNATYTENATKMLNFWSAIPYIMFMLLLAFGFISLFRRKTGEI